MHDGLYYKVLYKIFWYLDEEYSSSENSLKNPTAFSSASSQIGIYKNIISQITIVLFTPFDLASSPPFIIESENHSMHRFTALKRKCVLYFSRFFFQLIPVLSKTLLIENPEFSKYISSPSIPWKKIVSRLSHEPIKPSLEITELLSNRNPSKLEKLQNSQRQNNSKDDFIKSYSTEILISVITNLTSFVMPKAVSSDNCKYTSVKKPKYKHTSPISTPHECNRFKEIDTNNVEYEKSWYEISIDLALHWIDPSSINIIIELINIGKINDPISRINYISKNKEAFNNFTNFNYILVPNYVSYLYCKDFMEILFDCGGVIDSFDPSLPQNSFKQNSLKYLSRITQLCDYESRFLFLSTLSNAENYILNKIWPCLVNNYSIRSVFGQEKSSWDLINYSRAWELQQDNLSSEKLKFHTETFAQEYYDWDKVWLGLELVLIIIHEKLKRATNKDFNKILSVDANSSSSFTFWSYHPDAILLFAKVCRNIGVSICWLQLDSKNSSLYLTNPKTKSFSSWKLILDLSLNISKRLFLKDEKLNWTKSENFWQIDCSQLHLSLISNPIVNDKEFVDHLKSQDKKFSSEFAKVFSVRHYGKELVNSISAIPESDDLDSDSNSDTESLNSDSEDLSNDEAFNINQLGDAYNNRPLTNERVSQPVGTDSSRNKFIKKGKKSFFSANKLDILKSSINIILKMPFTVPFKERVYIFNSLVKKDLQRLRDVVSKSINPYDPGFNRFSGFRNLDVSARIYIERGNELMDGFYSLYPLLTGKRPYYNGNIPSDASFSSNFDGESNSTDFGYPFVDRISENQTAYNTSPYSFSSDIIESPSGVDFHNNRNNFSNHSPEEILGLSHFDSGFEHGRTRGFRTISGISHNRRSQPVPNYQYSEYSPLIKSISHSDAFKLGFVVSFVDHYGNLEAGVDGGGVSREFVENFEKLVFNDNPSITSKHSSNRLFSQTKSDPPNIYPSSIDLLFISKMYSLILNKLKNPLDFEKQFKLFVLSGAMVGKSIYNQRFISSPFEFSDLFMSRWLGLTYDIDDLEQLDPTIYSGLMKIHEFESSSSSGNGSQATDELDFENDELYQTFGLDFTTTINIQDNLKLTLVLPSVEPEKNMFGDNSYSSVNFESSFDKTQDYIPMSINNTVLIDPKEIQPLTLKNKDKYLQSMIDFYINSKSSSVPQNMFLNGVFRITPCSWYRTLFCSPKELNTFLCNGSLYNSEIDISEWKANTVYSGEFRNEGRNHACVKMFWDIVENSLVENERRSLIKFITGSEQLPQNGFRGMDPTFCIQGIENDLSEPENPPLSDTNSGNVGSSTHSNSTGASISFGSSLGFGSAVSSINQQLSGFGSNSGASNTQQSRNSIPKNKPSDSKGELDTLSIEEKELKFGRFPSASTCANLLKLPVYSTRAALKQ
ncbi:putative E3 ubiquitin protein ligase [Smittium culicis]|uniref:HECT-type E3 ubiquitin transferase n=2 Tax=Smittium culicis TaxID=133412 RepID=A0A1R1XPT2_9FUNG|nr:putative E3 ubiquitin protein ligase [Smittium culicis]